LSALLGVAALAVALAVYRPQLLRPWVERALAPRGGTASLSAIEVSLSPPVLALSGLAIVPPPSGEGDSLRVNHLRIELIPGRLFRGGPWVRHLEARGVIYERTRPREAEGPPDLTQLTRLFDIENLSLTDARLRVAVSQGFLAVDGLRLILAPGKSGTRAFSGSWDLSFQGKGSTPFAGRLSASGNVTPEPAFTVDLVSEMGRLDLPWISGDVSGRARLRVTRKNLLIEDLVLTVPRGRVSPGPREADITGPIRLDATAGATLDVRDPHLEIRGLDIGGLLLARGRLGGPSIDEISGTLDGEFPQVERLRSFWAPLLPGTLSGMTLAGRLPWRLSLTGGISKGDLILELLPPDMEVALASAGLDCRFGGSLRAAGPLDGWRHGKAAMSGRIRGTGHFARTPLAVRRFRFDTALAGAIAVPSLPEWSLSAEPGEVLYEGRTLPLGSVAIRGSARPAAGSWRVDGVEIRTGSVGRWTGRVEYGRGKAGGILNGERLPADNLVTLAAALGGYEWEKWSPTGAIDIAVRLDPLEDGQRVAATATLGQIGFRSPDGDAMGQLLAGTVDVEADLVPRPRGTVSLALRQGEALWGTVYLDLAKGPLDLRVGGTRAGTGAYEALLLDGGLEGFGRLKIEGKARRDRGGWSHQGRLALRDARLGPIFRTFLRDPLASSHPDLAGLEMEGAAEADLSFSGIGKTADMDGRLRLRLADLHRAAEPPLLSGLDVDLPISYSLGAANPARPAPSDVKTWGRLRLAKIRIGGQELGPLEVPAVLVPNRLHLGGAIQASLYGANLTFRKILADEPLSREFRIRMAAELGDLDLSRIAGKDSIQGHIGGVLDPVIIGPDRVTADGELRGDLFGGRLGVRRVTVERPFSAGREIGADVNVDRIDLERFSAVLGIGSITGRLSGSMAGLRVAYGQPVAFHLKMESVPVKGVGQSVSLKAVNSISLMSTGSSLSGLGISMMTTFFREFPYEKIGFECGLKNDVFTVRGLIHEDGVEYLVKRRFFAGINVINGNPDNRIGFSDMLERAKRVTGERSN
jgi:hypothetical protein